MMVRNFKTTDLPIVSEIEPRCFKQPWKEEMFAAVLSMPFQHAFVLEEAGQVCGYCCFSVLFDEAEILNIAVDVPYRKNGYGASLLTSALHTSRDLGAATCFLEVRASNEAAIALYQKFGFETFGVRKKYYDDGEDAFVMKKTL